MQFLIVHNYFYYVRLLTLISTSNHMFARAIWDKLPESIFENFEIAQVEWGQFQIFKNHEGDLSHKFLEPNMWLLINHTKPTNTLHWN